MRGLDPAVASKLAKVAGLLGSDFDGERAAAAAKATMLLRAHGLTWADVFAPAPATVPAMHASHVAEAQWALRFHDRLTGWERQFLGDITRRSRLSAKQRAALSGITHRLRGGGPT